MAQLKQSEFCPFVGRDCLGLGCKFYKHIRGMDKNTGKEFDDWDCTFNWIPSLIIEVSCETRQGAAATESFRNEMVRQQSIALQMLSERSKEEKVVGSEEILPLK